VPEHIPRAMLIDAAEGLRAAAATIIEASNKAMEGDLKAALYMLGGLDEYFRELEELLAAEADDPYCAMLRYYLKLVETLKAGVDTLVIVRLAEEERLASLEDDIVDDETATLSGLRSNLERVFIEFIEPAVTTYRTDVVEGVVNMLGPVLRIYIDPGGGEE